MLSRCWELIIEEVHIEGGVSAETRLGLPGRWARQFFGEGDSYKRIYWIIRRIDGLMNRGVRGWFMSVIMIEVVAEEGQELTGFYIGNWIGRLDGWAVRLLMVMNLHCAAIYNQRQALHVAIKLGMAYHYVHYCAVDIFQWFLGEIYKGEWLWLYTSINVWWGCFQSQWV